MFAGVCGSLEGVQVVVEEKEALWSQWEWGAECLSARPHAALWGS